ncbi:MAG: hypothetical protein WKF88_07745 [Ferruginibacter sp.]
MNQSERILIPLFERFIKDTYKGRRLKADGSRIKNQTVRNYEYILDYLKEFEVIEDKPIRIKTINGTNKRIFLAEKKYWKKFYLGFTNYLYTKKAFHDNYVGMVIKIIRIFFNYLNKDLGIRTGEFYKDFYVSREDVPIITLLPDQLQFLINDSEFDRQLTPALKKSKDIFVFGCTVALRVSDLFSIQFNDILSYGQAYYLPVKTIKTGTEVRIKLPEYAIRIAKKFRLASKKRNQLFPPIPRTRFNNHLKQIAELAGWTEEIGKFRNRRGKAFEEAFRRGSGRRRL